MRDRIRLCGIYRVALWNEDRGYIGSSVDIEKRWKNHHRLLAKGTHHSPYLQHAWDHYGPEAFLFEILERCPVDRLIEREQWWIDNSDSAFNANPTAGAPPIRTGWHHSLETRAKMSQSAMGHPVSPETAKRVADSQRGRPGTPHSQEFIERLRTERVGEGNPFFGRKHTAETRAKISEAQNRRFASSLT